MKRIYYKPIITSILFVFFLIVLLLQRHNNLRLKNNIEKIYYTVPSLFTINREAISHLYQKEIFNNQRKLVFMMPEMSCHSCRVKTYLILSEIVTEKRVGNIILLFDNDIQIRNLNVVLNQYNISSIEKQAVKFNSLDRPQILVVNSEGEILFSYKISFDVFRMTEECIDKAISILNDGLS